MSIPVQPAVIRSDALALPLADNSVDLVVTSPPYFALRSYQDAGEHYAGQIGSEATPAAFVDALIAATREMVRVVKPSGSIWVNLGDKYSTGSSGDRNNGFNERSGNASGQRVQERSQVRSAAVAGMRPKSLIGVPWRYALRCIDDLGLILRAEVIWSKPNGLPESVTDRVRRSHETWFHFTREPRYYSAVDEIREPHTYPNDDRSKRPSGYLREMTGHMNGAPNPLGKLPGSVWTIPTEPLKVPAELGIDHFAAFPMEWPRRIIQGWSPRGVCTACGEGRRPVTTHLGYTIEGGVNNGTDPATTSHATGRATLGMVGRREVTGYACACTPFHLDDDGSIAGPVKVYDWHLWTNPPPTTPAVVLDPFGGTGTTALVAKALGRRGISVDMSADYCRLARWRTTDEGEYARALQVPKPAVQAEGQTSLFDLLDGTDG